MDGFIGNTCPIYGSMGGHGPVAAHKVSHQVCHFGGIFTFSVVGVMILTLDGHGRLTLRAQRNFFEDFGYLAPEIAKIFLLAGVSYQDLVPSSVIMGRILGYGDHR